MIRSFVGKIITLFTFHTKIRRPRPPFPTISRDSLRWSHRYQPWCEQRIRCIYLSIDRPHLHYNTCLRRNCSRCLSIVRVGCLFIHRTRPFLTVGRRDSSRTHITVCKPNIPRHQYPFLPSGENKEGRNQGGCLLATYDVNFIHVAYILYVPSQLQVPTPLMHLSASLVDTRR